MFRTWRSSTISSYLRALQVQLASLEKELAECRLKIKCAGLFNQTAGKRKTWAVNPRTIVKVGSASLIALGIDTSG